MLYKVAPSAILALFVLISSTDALDIVSRAAWGAVPPKSITNLAVNPPTHLVVHHTDTPACATPNECYTRIRNIQHYHMTERKYSDIGYNFLISQDGTIYEGQGWGRWGAHAGPLVNNRSIGVSFIGKFDSASPSQASIDALKSFIKYALDTNRLSKTYKLMGHKGVKPTSCPGNNLYKILQTMPNFSASV